MFATGIGLINRKAWGARWWAWGAWAKIARLVLIWAVFIVAVAPKLAEIMARTVLVTLQRQNLPANRLPPLPDLIRIYSIMFLGTGVAMIFLGAIYPAISLWVLSRPGVKAALVEKPPTEPELP
jgi:flagellar biosynthesis protein FlhB